MAPAVAVPAAATIGSSLIGGMFGKSAQKKQKKLAEEQQRQQNALAQQQMQMQQQMIDAGKPFMAGAQQALGDAKSWWAPLMSGNRTAIDQFLSPERRAINQGFQSAAQNAAQFGPRGGGRVSALMGMDMARQGQLSDLVWNARRTAVGETSNLGQLMGQLGGSYMGMGSGMGQAASGMSGKGYDVMNNFFQNQKPNQGFAQAGQILGSVLPHLFKPKGAAGAASGGGGGSYDSGD